MISSLQISTTDSRLYLSLASHLPDGVRITSPAPPFRKGFDLGVNVTIDITVDLTTVVTGAFVLWLISKLGKAKRPIKVNGKYLPENETEAKHLITHEIESEAHEKDNDN